MIFFSLVFTLDGRDPAENKYVNMFWLMIKSLCTSGTYDPLRDCIYVMADSETYRVIQDKWPMDGICPLPIWVSIPRPTKLLEGIARRYEFLNRAAISADDTGLYLDVDFLCLKKFRFEVPPDTIVVLPEGGRDDPNYCGEGNWARLDHDGLSAGFWAFRVGPSIRALLDEIAMSVRREPRKFFTEDQPFFNACITKKTRAVYFNPKIVSFNGHNMTPETCLINCAGMPGNGALHWEKMSTFAAMLKLGT